MLTAALAATAVLAGLAGSWSPCGLSMVETLAPDACGGRRRTSASGAGAFAIGALAGGVATYGGLALLGERLGVQGGLAVAVAVAGLLAAAAGDAAGRRIVPQVRRQVPESWRRILPLPLAAALYGVLLGLGFTTFLLSFATWALAGACLALGSPATGIAIGIGFGAGRAVPIALLAPFSGGAAALGARPQVLRGLRGVAAAGLAVAAAVLVVSPPEARAAATLFAEAARDPSASGGLLAYQPTEGNGVLVRNGEYVALPGTHPAVSGSLAAWVADEQIVVADAETLQPLAAVPAPGADAVGLSQSHLAWRAGEAILAVGLAAPNAPPTRVAVARRRGQLGRPVIDGTRTVFDDQAPAGSRIRMRDLATGGRRTLRSARRALLLAPSMVDGRLMYVRSTYKRQRVLLGGREIYSAPPTARRDAGHERGRSNHRAGYPRGRRPPGVPRPRAGLTVTLWSTAFDGDSAYVTSLRHRRGGRIDARILRLDP